MKSFLLILLLTLPAFSQCDRTSNAKERFDALRITPPSRILNWDGRTLDIKYEDKVGIYYLTLTTDKDSVIQIPQDYKKKYFWVVWSICGSYAQTVVEVKPEQMRKAK